MPAYRCGGCGEEFFERSHLAVMSPCPECGDEGTVELAIGDDGPPSAPTVRPDRRAEIRTAADSLLGELGISAPPVDVAWIAGTLGFPVSYTTLGNVDGDLRDGRIRVNRNSSRVRQRFTIAHEIGHLRLHPGAGRSGPSEEREADQFAAALLIPLMMLREAAASETSFDVLQRRFEVSRPALSIALAQAKLSVRISDP